MNESFSILLTSLEQFLAPQQTIYDYLIRQTPASNYVFGFLAVMGVLLVLIGGFALSSSGYETIERFLDMIQAAPRLMGMILLVVICFVAAVISGDRALKGLFQAVLITYGIFGYVTSKMAVLLGAYRIGIWGADHKLAALIAFGSGYAVSFYLSTIPWIPFLVSLLFLLFVCWEVYVFSLERNFNQGFALGLALLAGLGGIYESAIDIGSLGGFWTWFAAALKFIFLIGFAFGFIRERLQR